MAAPAVRLKTIEDFRCLPEGTLCQLIEGELVMTPAPSTKHQMVVANLYFLIRNFVNKHNLGIVLFSPIDVYLDKENAYQPDIVFINQNRLDIIKEDGIYGAPDLVIEVLSPSTAYYDLKIKFRVYENYGVKEYWIVDPELKEIEMYSLKRAKFALSQVVKEEEEIVSEVLSGLKIRLKEIFK